MMEKNELLAKIEKYKNILEILISETRRIRYLFEKYNVEVLDNNNPIIKLLMREETEIQRLITLKKDIEKYRSIGIRSSTTYDSPSISSTLDDICIKTEELISDHNKLFSKYKGNMM